MNAIRPFEPADWAGVWPILEPVFRAGETYAVDPAISEEDAHALWIGRPAATFVAVDENGNIAGTYYIKPNQSGPGDHVCNCGYVVGEAARGRGVASQMCVHSQQVAVRMGFRGMQFNLVVATNDGAVRLWQKHGFDIVGTVPQAFLHPRHGFVAAYVMFKLLTG